MKNLNLNNYGVQEMNAEEMKTTEGGAGWSDAIWMFAKEIVDGYVAACTAVQSYTVATGGAYYCHSTR
jgi:hypothetical protein